MRKTVYPLSMSRTKKSIAVHQKKNHRLGYLGVIPVIASVGVLLLFWLVGVLPSAAQGNNSDAVIRYVTDTGTGTICSQAFPCALQTAVDLSVNGDEVRVAAGSYFGTGSTPVLNLNSAISVIGGYDTSWGDPDPITNETILDGQNGRRVVSITGNGVLQGFIIRNGSSNAGAGINVVSGTPTIINNRIHDNHTVGSGTNGGGIFDAGSANIYGNQIYDNSAVRSGGGIFVDNDTATSDTLIRFNLIYDNLAGGGATITPIGGGVFLENGSRAFLEGNNIYLNSARNGGGIGTGSSNISALLQNNLFHHNSSTSVAGAIYVASDVTLWNNTIVYNSSGTTGGVYIQTTVTQVDFYNNIVAFNSGGSNDGVFNAGSATVNGAYNNIFNDSDNVNLLNEIVGDPDFVNAANNNFHILSSSVDVDAGDPTTPATINIDIDGETRPFPAGGAVDVGADEYHPGIPQFTFTPTYYEQYVSRNNTADLTHLLENVGTAIDSYSFSCNNDQGWGVVCPETTGNLVPGETADITTTITVPDGPALAESLTTITATSQFSPALQHVVQVLSIIQPISGISFTPNYSDSLFPDTVITFTHRLTNTGDSLDNITVELSSDPGGWAELLPSNLFVVPLAPNQTTAVQVRVTVPPFAPSGFFNTSVIQATSQYNTDVFDTVAITITAKATTGIRYVSVGGQDTNNNCTQKDFPCLTVARGVSQASFGDEVRVRYGSYNVSPEIAVNDTIHISGGWNNSFTEQLEADQTVLSGGGTSRIFNIAPGAAIQPTIDNMTLQNGNSNTTGGAIFVGNQAQPTFTRLIFAENQASQGGAVYAGSNSNLQVIQSHFLTNTASSNGGAIFASASTLRLEQTSFRANSAQGVAAVQGGGAVYVNNGVFIGENVLFAENSTASNGGAVYIQSGNLNLIHATIVGNEAQTGGGGVFNGGATAVIVSTILADNTAPTGSAIQHSGSNSTGLSYSDLWNNNNVGVTDLGNNLNVNPQFSDPLYHLIADSLVKDAADPDSPAIVDFEDEVRPSDAGFDMGYDEVAGCRAKRGDIIYGSIQDALDANNFADLIQVTGICRQSVTVNESVTIQGGWNGDFSERTFEPTYIDAQGNGRGLYLSGSISTTIEGLTILNGNATGLGGGPSGQDAGGGVYVESGEVAFYGVSVFSSTADIGAGFYNHTGSPHLALLIPDPEEFSNIEPFISRIITNTATTSGGGIYNYNGPMVLNGVFLRNNSANLNGGGIYNLQGALTAQNVVLADNHAASSGGGVYNQATVATFLHLTLYGNTAVTNGGGFYNAAGSPAIRNSIFSNNTAVSGPAIFSLLSGLSVDYNYYYPHTSPSQAVVGTGAGSNSITSNSIAPGFIDPTLNNFHLLEGAPTEDAADPVSPVISDFDSEPRPSNQGPDIGADEIVGCLARVNNVIYGSVQRAIQAADPGDQIDVAGRCSGVHTFNTGSVGGGLGTIDVTVHITKAVVISGGWSIDFERQDEITYLDAQNEGRVIYIAPGITATVHSFDILQGSGTNGGAIYIDNAPAAILNNQIYSSTAVNGSAIYITNSPAVIDGGNRIFHNTASGNGTVYITTSSAETAVQNNFVYANTAASGAGFYNAAGNNTFWHNTVVLNSAIGNGGGFFALANSPQLIGNIVMSNTAVSGGGAYGQAGSTPLLGYNDFFGNSSDFGGSISAGGTGHLTENPSFTGIPTFTLPITSPVVDQGDSELPLYWDYEGDIRPSHQGPDMGADEIGGCYARILREPTTIYGSAQRAVDLAVSGDTVQVEGICYGVNTRSLGIAGDVVQNLFVDKDITLDGDWSYKSAVTGTLDALTVGRVLYVASGTTITVTEMTLQHGNGDGAGLLDAGGGVFNDGVLNLFFSRVQTSTATTGGGVYNGGDLLMEGTWLVFNTATDGGGYYDGAAADGNIHQNVFTLNQATNQGGAVYHNNGVLLLDGNRLWANTAVNGAGVYIATGNSDSAKVWNNILFGNLASSGAGIYNANSSGRIWHNTLVANTGGGIYSAANNPSIRNNIVDSNLGIGIQVVSGSPSVGYNNVINNTTDYSGITPGSGAISEPPFYYDPLNNDYHLVDGSPGEDVAEDLGLLNDIDDDIRPTNGGPDIGADEINSCLVRVGDQIFGVFQEAIDYAETEGIMLVEVARGQCSGVISRNGSLQVGYISQNLDIRGSLSRDNFSDPGDYYSDEVGTVSTLINPQGEGRAIVVANGAEPTFTHFGFLNGNGSVGGNGNGGAVYVESGNVTFVECITGQNTAVQGGGYYVNSGANMTLTGGTTGLSRVARVTELPNGDLNIISIYLTANETSGSGAAVQIAAGATSDLYNHAFLYNVAGGSGGAFYNAGNSRLINATFYQNSSDGSGGAVYSVGNLEMYHNTVNTNTAVGNGGGVADASPGGSTFVVNSTILVGNTGSNGGGIYSANGNGQADYNDYFANTPNNVAGLDDGDNSIFEDPQVFIAYLPIGSPAIDKADPSLLDPGVGNPPLSIDFDLNNQLRPDGNGNPDYQFTYGYGSDMGADEYYKDWGCEVLPSNETATGVPGGVLTYTVEIWNVGNPSFFGDGVSHGYTDTITITLNSTQGWSTLQNGPEEVIELGYTDFVQRILTVTVPITTVSGIQDVSSVRCRSASIPSRTDAGTTTTNVGEVGSLDIEPDYTTSALPGDVITFTHVLTNKGNSFEEIAVVPNAGPANATASILTDPVVTLGQFQTATVALEVTILDTAVANDTATPGVVVYLIDDPEVTDAVQNIISIGFTSGTRYVADFGQDNTNCTDPLLPCATIQHAVDQAVDGDTILVAAGTYTDFTTQTVGTDEVIQNVFVDKSVTIRGGYDAGDGYSVSQPITNAVILSGTHDHRVFYIADGVTVTLSSLFVVGGAPHADDPLLHAGGGIYNAGANLTVNGVWVWQNTAQFGAGLFHADGNLAVQSSVLAHNVNTNPQDGCGLGGGAFVAAGTAVIENNTFTNNQVNLCGSLSTEGVVTPLGGGLYVGGGTATLLNNIFADNQAFVAPAVYITNTTLLENDYNLYTPSEVQPSNVPTGTNSLTGNPDFLDSYFHIASSSDAKDSGTSAVSIINGVDFDLEPRLQGIQVDMGADERLQRAEFTFTPITQTVTINAGASHTFDHVLRNTGDFTDTYTLVLSGQSIPPGGGWDCCSLSSTTITDLLPGEQVSVTLVITGGNPGYQYEAVITADSQFNGTHAVTDTTIISHTPGVDIESSLAGSGGPGQPVVYEHTLTNSGDGVDEFHLSVEGADPPGWVITVTPTATGFLSPNETIPFTVTVLVPPGTPSDTIHTAVIRADAFDPDASDTLTDTTTVTAAYGVTLEPDNAQITPENSTVVYTHTLTNIGNIVDTVSLSVQSNPNWTVTVEPQVVTDMPPLATQLVTVTVTVPPGTDGTIHVATVTALSEDGITSATAVNTTTVTAKVAFDVRIGPNGRQTGNPGDTLQYQHIITNTGATADTYDLTVNSSLGWSVSVSPTFISLNPGVTGEAVVTVSIPPDATAGEVDVTTVTAVSQGDNTVSDSATDVTTVAGGATTAYLPLIFKPDSSIPTPTPTATSPSLTVTPSPTFTPTPGPSPTACAPTNIDLVVTAIQVQPNPPASGQPATILVTIQNQGSNNVAYGNNFYLDFYVDQTPAIFVQGNIYWGVQGVYMQAGASRTYQGVFTFSSGSHQLWAQVDTDNSVNECPMENNNILGPIPLTVNGFSDEGSSEAITTPDLDVQLGLPRATPTLEGWQPPAEEPPSPTASVTVTPPILPVLPVHTPTPPSLPPVDDN